MSNLDLKAQLTGNQAHCTRCAGRGIYYISVLNGNGVAAHPDQGVCWRCHGTGIDPTVTADDVRKENFRTMQRVFYRIATEIQEVQGHCGINDMRESLDKIYHFDSEEARDKAMQMAAIHLQEIGYLTITWEDGIVWYNTTAYGEERWQAFRQPQHA